MGRRPLDPLDVKRRRVLYVSDRDWPAVERAIVAAVERLEGKRRKRRKPPTLTPDGPRPPMEWHADADGPLTLRLARPRPPMGHPPSLGVPPNVMPCAIVMFDDLPADESVPVVSTLTPAG